MRKRLRKIIKGLTALQGGCSMKEDVDADKAFGWILEMYAFAAASAARPEGPVPYEIRRDLAVQPPFDTFLKWAGNPVCIIHYTYACDYDKNGYLQYAKIQRGGYHFDKRDFTFIYPRPPLPIPPDNLQDGGIVTKMIAMMNEAMENLRPWP
jgi:hydroxyproline O-arabinosyltransferase